MTNHKRPCFGWMVPVFLWCLVQKNHRKRVQKSYSHKPHKPQLWLVKWKEKNCTGDFPGGPVAKNPPATAGDVGSIPGRGSKTPHAAGQLSLCHNYWAQVLEPSGHVERSCQLQPPPEAAKNKYLQTKTKWLLISFSLEPERIFKVNNYSGPHSCYLLWASSYQQVWFKNTTEQKERVFMWLFSL